MSLNPAQRQIADAYSQVFASTPATQAVLDDLTVYANGLGEPLVRAGATLLLLYVLTKRSALRREKAREKANG